VSIYGDAKIKALEDVIDYAQKEIEKIQRFEGKQVKDNGPYWHCTACQLTCYGWKGDTHKCPYCRAEALTPISEEVYRDNS